ncbi:MAG: tyrosine-type recombinase/integrase [Terriglobales bacterium]
MAASSGIKVLVGRDTVPAGLIPPKGEEVAAAGQQVLRPAANFSQSEGNAAMRKPTAPADPSRFNDAFIKRLPTPETDRYRIPDPRCAGLNVIVTSGGARTFVLRYRVKGTNLDRQLTIGRADVWSLRNAREEARKLMRKIDGGADPVGELRAQRQAPTINALFDAYLASEEFGMKAESTRYINRGRIERHLRPLLGKHKVEELTLKTIKDAAKSIEEGSTAVVEKTRPRGLARVRGGAGTANEAMKLLRAICSWGVTEEVITTNPATGIKVKEAGARKGIFEDDTYHRFFDALNAMVDEGLSKNIADALRFVALTGCRRGEVSGMRWRHVDAKAAKVTLDLHKTKKTTGKDKVIKLIPATQELIARQPAGGPDDPVFGVHRADRLTAVFSQIRRKAGLPKGGDDGLMLHSFRHSVGSHLAMEGASNVELMKALGHSQIKTTLRYLTFAEEKKSNLAERAAAKAVAAMQAADGATSAEVVPLKK